MMIFDTMIIFIIKKSLSFCFSHSRWWEVVSRGDGWEETAEYRLRVSVSPGRGQTVRREGTGGADRRKEGRKCEEELNGTCWLKPTTLLSLVCFCHISEPTVITLRVPMSTWVKVYYNFVLNKQCYANIQKSREWLRNEVMGRCWQRVIIDQRSKAVWD